MPDTPAPSNLYSWLTSLTPSFDKLVTVLLTAVVAGGLGGLGGWALKPAPASFPVALPDLPTVVRVASSEPQLAAIAKALADLKTAQDRMAADVGELKAAVAAPATGGKRRVLKAAQQ